MPKSKRSCNSPLIVAGAITIGVLGAIASAKDSANKYDSEITYDSRDAGVAEEENRFVDGGEVISKAKQTQLDAINPQLRKVQEGFRQRSLPKRTVTVTLNDDLDRILSSEGWERFKPSDAGMPPTSETVLGYFNPQGGTFCPGEPSLTAQMFRTFIISYVGYEPKSCRESLPLFIPNVIPDVGIGIAGARRLLRPDTSASTTLTRDHDGGASIDAGLETRDGGVEADAGVPTVDTTFPIADISYSPEEVTAPDAGVALEVTPSEETILTWGVGAGVRYVRDMPRVAPEVRAYVSKSLGAGFSATAGVNPRFAQRLQRDYVSVTSDPQRVQELITCEGESSCTRAVYRIQEDGTSEQGTAHDNVTDFGGPYAGASYEIYLGDRVFVAVSAAALVDIRRQSTRMDTTTTRTRRLFYELEGSVIRDLSLGSEIIANGRSEHNATYGGLEALFAPSVSIPLGEGRFVIIPSGSYNFRTADPQKAWGAALDLGYERDVRKDVKKEDK